ncbi:AAA family ATPase [Glaciihabitans arcticus]|uniref:AAA family ATPase n=1 Tax=Glaciihabitans arcticus TaxID=2668039 RepID=A0A4Q9GPM2_9MICO|nr:AAA family ATPase [Glaciihabitans arcticus]TBN55541.1 AAA family ATPase [Glaciihabitans arcticus]
MSDDLLAGLAAAVRALPDDVALRLHYAEQLLLAGHPTDAIEQSTVVLDKHAGHPDATALVQRAAASLGAPPAAPAPAAAPNTAPDLDSIDWDQHEREIQSPIKPPFVLMGADESGLVVTENDDVDPEMRVTRETMTLADVGGLEPVKKRINEAFLEPMRHPEIAKAFGKSLRGGLLLYGPPGCGKTFVARAIAGELNAHFISVTISDILDKFLGESEANMHNVFERARELAPAVLFFDEVDAVGGKRSSSMQSGGMRNVVNQMLMEMDGIGSENDGLFVLAATNHPWDVDAALLRPGRFDRMVLVLPPDEPAREAILKVHLKGRPVEGIDLRELVAKTDGYSGADLQHVCSTAGEKAMMASIAAGEVRPINMDDLRSALVDVKPSIGSWLQSARNVAAYGNASGQYDDLVDFLKSKKLL